MCRNTKARRLQTQVGIAKGHDLQLLGTQVHMPLNPEAHVILDLHPSSYFEDVFFSPVVFNWIRFHWTFFFWGGGSRMGAPFALVPPPFPVCSKDPTTRGGGHKARFFLLFLFPLGESNPRAL